MSSLSLKTMFRMAEAAAPWVRRCAAWNSITAVMTVAPLHSSTTCLALSLCLRQTATRAAQPASAVEARLRYLVMAAPGHLREAGQEAGPLHDRHPIGLVPDAAGDDSVEDGRRHGGVLPNGEQPVHQLHPLRLQVVRVGVHHLGEGDQHLAADGGLLLLPGQPEQSAVGAGVGGKDALREVGGAALLDGEEGGQSAPALVLGVAKLQSASTMPSKKLMPGACRTGKAVRSSSTLPRVLHRPVSQDTNTVAELCDTNV